MLIIKSVWGGREVASSSLVIPTYLKHWISNEVRCFLVIPDHDVCVFLIRTDSLMQKNAMHCIGEDKALHMPIQCFAWGNGKHCIKIPTKTNCRYTCHPHKSSRASHPTSESPPRRLGKRWKTWDTIKYELTMYVFGHYLNVRVLTLHTRFLTIRNNFLPRLPSTFINFYGEKN